MCKNPQHLQPSDRGLLRKGRADKVAQNEILDVLRIVPSAIEKLSLMRPSKRWPTLSPNRWLIWKANRANPLIAACARERNVWPGQLDKVRSGPCSKIGTNRPG